MNLHFPRKTKESIQPINVAAVEKHYGGKYIGDFCVKNTSGGWAEMPIAIFYQPNPDRDQGHTNYFGIFVNEDDRIVITCGNSAFETPITGVVADDGEIIYSRYRHDYRLSSDGSTFIDGGRDYVRTNDPTRCIPLIIKKDKLIIDPNFEPNANTNEDILMALKQIKNNQLRS